MIRWLWNMPDGFLKSRMVRLPGMRGGNSMYLLRLAFRNLFRRRGRTFLIALILSMAVVFFLFMESFMTGLNDMGFNNVIEFETPHIEIGRRDFFIEADDGNILPLEETFIPEEEMLLAINNIEGLVGMTPVLD